LSIAEFKSDPNQIQQKYATDWARINNRRDGVFAEVFLGDWEVIAEAGWREKQLRSMSQGFAYDYDVDAKSVGLRAKNEAQFGGFKNQLVIGHDYNTWNNKNLTYLTASEQKSKAWYVQDDVMLASGTRISAGIRTDDIVKDGRRQLEDRQNAWDFGFSHPLSTVSRIWSRLGESFRLANIDELDPDVNIRPQISKDFEAGWSWKQSGYQIETRFFRSDLTDEIALDPNAGGFFGKNINLDPTRRQGIEIDNRLSVSSKLTLSGNLALRRVTFQSGNYAGHDIPLVARETLALRAQWSVAEGHQVTGGVNWVGARYADFDNQCRMPDYTTVDLRYARKFSNAEFSLSVNNLLDHQFYTNATCSTAKVLSVYPEAGRTFLAAVRVNF
jgi:iron complex outermembrane receptor protein